MKNINNLDVYKRYNKRFFSVDLPWGQIKKVHTIGDITIYEYYNHADNETAFHPYINNRDTNSSYNTLDQAAIGAIAVKYNNHRAEQYVFKMLDM